MNKISMSNKINKSILLNLIVETIILLFLFKIMKRIFIIGKFIKITDLQILKISVKF